MRILILLVVAGLVLFIAWLIVSWVRPKQRPPADEFDRELFAQYNQLKRQANAAYLSNQKEYGDLLSKQAKEVLDKILAPTTAAQPTQVGESITVMYRSERSGTPVT